LKDILKSLKNQSTTPDEKAEDKKKKKKIEK